MTSANSTQTGMAAPDVQRQLMRAEWPALVLACALVLALALSCACVFSAAFPKPALGNTLTAAAKAKNTVLTTSSKERRAYKRAVAACMDYANQPNPIVVDLSDLKLTRKQAKNVWNMIHANGELFWINCYGDTYTKTRFSLPCYYSDAKITRMRKKLDAAVAKALKRIGPGMNPATKVHMLHDYIIDRMDYKDGEKTAYTGLVQGKGDCFGFALATDVLLRRAGFTVDMAFNNKLDHAWNLVKVSGKWYHVDTTWDNGYTGQNYLSNFNWTKRRCHLYLLQSDASMAKRTTDPSTGMYISKTHNGWTCHHRCTSTTYDFKRDLNKGFYRHCKDYKSIVRSFSSSGLRYRVVGVGKVRLQSVGSKSARAAKSLVVSAAVKCRGTSYKVCGIASGGLAKAKAKTLLVSSGSLTKAKVKGSLAGSAVKTVKLQGAAAKKRAAYKAYFAKSNSGKSVKVV